MRSLAPVPVLALCLTLPATAAPRDPAPQTPEEILRVAQIGSALMVRLAERMEWPAEAFPEATSPFAICVVGDDPFGEALLAFAGRRSKERSIEVKHFSSARSLSYCPVLFISESEVPRLGQLIEALRTSPVLTVSYLEGFCEAGGGIRLVRRTNNLGFDINPNAIERAGLRFDPSLRRLAMKVRSH